jgi:hypothetical protein
MQSTTDSYDGRRYGVRIPQPAVEPIVSVIAVERIRGQLWSMNPARRSALSKLISGALPGTKDALRRAAGLAHNLQRDARISTHTPSLPAPCQAVKLRRLRVLRNSWRRRCKRTFPKMKLGANCALGGARTPKACGLSKPFAAITKTSAVTPPSVPKPSSWLKFDNELRRCTRRPSSDGEPGGSAPLPGVKPTP